jgi:hypothetical protein
MSVTWRFASFLAMRAGSVSSVPIVVVGALGLLASTLWTLAGGGDRGRLVPPLLTVGFAILWVLVNKPVEGPTVLTLSRGHGVTVSDLVSVVAVAIAGRRMLGR